MTFHEFKDSLNGTLPPENLSTYLLSLWYDGRGDWVRAHDLVDSLTTAEAAHVHAYLHRKEGDLNFAFFAVTPHNNPCAKM